MKAGRTKALALGALGAALLPGAAWAGYAALQWLRYPPGPCLPREETPLAPFLPEPEVEGRVAVWIAAPPTAVMAVLRSLELQKLPAIRALFALRARLMGGGTARRPAGEGPFVVRMQQLGWRLLSEDPERYVVFGTVTESWKADVAFRPLAPAGFVAFAEPGYVKIAWTFRAEPSGAGTRCIAETRVVATSEDARRRFRRYWAVFSPGMLLVRLFALRAIKRAAERR